MNENTINNDVTIAGSESVLAGRYRILKQLGAGGMGSVWLAEDMQLDNKLFAIKMLPSILVSNKRAYNQLKSEALVAMKLVHPNIVQIRAFEENNGNPFLVMDYIDGETLDDWLGDRGQELGCRSQELGVSEEEVVKLLKPIAEALDYAHTEGVVHRDVKPANVMIRKDGRPFIMDFGIAREIQETLTRVTGKLSSGTLLYMSPEQLNGASPKPAQDVYSFAAMVYECLKGEPPFCRGAIEDQIKNKEPEPLPAGVGIAASVMRGLAKQQENRPENCQKVFAETANHDKKPGAGAKRIDSGALGEDVSHERSRIGWFLAFLFFMVFVGILWWNGNRNSFEPGEGPVSPPVTNKVDNLPPRPPTPPIEAEVKEIAVEAAVQKEKIKGVDEADGFGLKKNDLSELLTRAIAYGKANSWGNAALSFTNYVEGCKALIQLDAERQAAKDKRRKTAATRKRAEAEESAKYALDRWSAACNIVMDAEKLFQEMNFSESGRYYEMAFSQFEECVSEAKKERERKEKERTAVSEKDVNLRKAKEAFDAKRYDEAYQLFMKSDLENKEVQYFLGRMYAYGQGVQKNEYEAVKWYRRAAEQGYPSAQNSLGIMYKGGRGVTKDDYEAVKCFRKSAEQGDCMGQCHLGQMYLDGRGVVQNDYEAVKWFRKASEHGHVIGHNRLAFMYASGRGVARNEAEAFRLYRLSADKFPPSWYVIASMYENGSGVSRDVEEAKKWYRKAAEKGDENAKKALERLENVRVVKPVKYVQPVASQPQQPVLIDRPHNLKYCDNCGHALWRLKKISPRCEKCGKILFKPEAPPKDTTGKDVEALGNLLRGIGGGL